MRPLIMTVPPTLPSIDLAALPAEARPAVTALLKLAETLLRENQLLRDRVDLLVRRYFGGQKNEALSPAQLELLLQGFTNELLAGAKPPPPSPAPEGNKPPRPTRKPRGPVRTGVPAHLPLRHSSLLIPAEVQAHPELFREIDRTVTQVLDYEPGRFCRDEIIRPRFVRREAATPAATVPPGPAGSVPTATPAPEVLAAPLPNRLIEKGLPGVGLLVYLILSRYEDHQPFYRLQKAFDQRAGVRLSRQTMSGWMDVVADWFHPLVDQLRTQLLAGGYLQVDETPIRYLDRTTPGQSHLGFFWVYHQPGGDVIFDWQTSRAREGPRRFLTGFKGRLQCDGYGVYPSLAKEFPEWTLHFCVAHWRRKFYEAKDEDRRAAWILGQLQHLYALEAELRQQGAGPRLRAARRAAVARPIWNRLQQLLPKWQPRVLPQSRLGKAIAYGLDLWAGMLRYLNDGRVEIDNNLVENCIRPTALGKKNFLFIGHPDAGGRSAVIYSILGSCRQRGINPELYLKDLLTRLPNMTTGQLKDYLPAEWIKRHPEARVQLPR